MERSCIWNFEPKEPERKLPESWEEFCAIKKREPQECWIDEESGIRSIKVEDPIFNDRICDYDRNLMPDLDTAKAMLALMQLIQLRNCYNGDWVPDWKDFDQDKYVIYFYKNEIEKSEFGYKCSILYFKSAELRDEFLRCFRPLIEKLKPLYGIHEGGSDGE